MKKYILSLLVLTVLVPQISSASFEVNLKHGSQGSKVYDLEDFLQSNDFYTGKLDGKYGLGVLKAVKAFQLANNLSVDGYFGKMSRAKANEILAETLSSSDAAELLETGSISTPVVEAQPTTDPVTQTKIDQLNQIAQQIASNTNTIAQNTTPLVTTPTPSLPVVISVPEDVNVNGVMDPNFQYPIFQGQPLGSSLIGSFTLTNNTSKDINITSYEVDIKDGNGNMLAQSDISSTLTGLLTSDMARNDSVPRATPQARNFFTQDYIFYPNQTKTINVNASVLSGTVFTVLFTATGKTNN